MFSVYKRLSVPTSFTKRNELLNSLRSVGPVTDLVLVFSIVDGHCSGDDPDMVLLFLSVQISPEEVPRPSRQTTLPKVKRTGTRDDEEVS